MTEAQKPAEASNTPENAKKSFSASETLGKLWDTIIQKETTEQQKKSMEDTIAKQRKELTEIVEKYKQEKSEIVGESKQDRLSLLLEVKNTISYMKNMSTWGIPDGQDGVVESTYEKLEGRITGTHENIDFKNPEFIKQAIMTLENFASDLGGAQKQNTGSETPKKPQNTKEEESGTIPQGSVEQKSEKTLKVKNLGEMKDGTPLKVTGKDVNFRDEKNKPLGKLGENANLTLDLSGGWKLTQYKEHTMIPVKFEDRIVYVAEKYLAKKEEIVAPVKDEKAAAEKPQKTGETTGDNASRLATEVAEKAKKTASAAVDAIKSALEPKKGKEGAETKPAPTDTKK